MQPFHGKCNLSEHNLATNVVKDLTIPKNCIPLEHNLATNIVKDLTIPHKCI